jgi:hypothetical protein
MPILHGYEPSEIRYRPPSPKTGRIPWLGSISAPRCDWNFDRNVKCDCPGGGFGALTAFVIVTAWFGSITM